MVVYDTRLHAAEIIDMVPSDMLSAATNPGASGPRTGAAPKAETTGAGPDVLDAASCVVMGSTLALASSHEYNWPVLLHAAITRAPLFLYWYTQTCCATPAGNSSSTQQHAAVKGHKEQQWALLVVFEF